MNNVGPRKVVQYNSSQYKRIRFLGQGSFGTATVHRRRSDCILVVLKEIDLSKFHDERGRQCAVQEAQIMSRLDHDNIVKYYNAFTTETKLIIEMEYASLGTLQAYLGFQNQPLDAQEILVIFRQIASGLSYLHSKSIMHLDLKMANIFVTIEGVIKIGDFGFAQFMPAAVQDGGRNSSSRQQQQLTSECQRLKEAKFRAQMKQSANLKSHQLGTLAYSSPERCLGETIDFKSDVWSLGCILYELIASKPLFASQSLTELVVYITRVQYQPIERGDVPNEMKEIFKSMIARNPADRPAAAELVERTDQLLLLMQMRRQRANSVGKQQQPERRVYNHYQQHNRLNLSSEVPVMTPQQQQALNSANDDPSPSINYPHSLVYQVSFGSAHVRVDRVNLPQTKRIREIRKGKSHYLALTYDNIVYGWGSKNYGQLGACGLTSSQLSGSAVSINASNSSLASSKATDPRKTRSARNSMNLKNDLKLMNCVQQQAATTSFSANSSLASSTQTIIAMPNTPPVPPSQQPPPPTFATNKSNKQQQQAANHQRLSKQLVMSMLERSRPASRPFILNELTNRKIIQVAAGNDFSVFLSKTGIVLTCGDSSTGCLGRSSDLRACFTPCMVDTLINYDVVSIACGPRHVVAVCGNGRAFAWGKWTYGRLGISLDLINKQRQQIKADKSSGQRAKDSDSFVFRPQLVELPDDVVVKSVHCGDRSTIFIDSNNRCWACGENRSNKLGLDVKRKFQRSIAVECCWTPSAIKPLKKYKIVACNIGKSHASFVTNDGKLVVCGQDVDHSHKLQVDLASKCTRKSSTRHGIANINRSASFSSTTANRYSDAKNSLNYTQITYQQLKHLNQLLRGDVNLFADRQMNLKHYPRRDLQMSSTFALSSKLNRSQRQLIDAYLKKSRAIKRMPFEYVVSVCCTSKFTLTLTGDNRVYFWGVRSYHSSDESGGHESSARTTHGPQLVTSCLDECLIKIGPTNSSLMSNIQSLGSDQPIIQAQDPQLTAASLEDLWILDYKPTKRPSISDALASTSSTSLSSICHSASDDDFEGRTSECSSNTCCPSCVSCDSCDSCDEVTKDPCDCSPMLRRRANLRHDAILKPQPMVSLYVPSTFNQFGCFLNLANLFCFDEDRFYLVLDTTTRLQAPTPSVSGRHAASLASPAQAARPSAARTQAQPPPDFAAVKSQPQPLKLNIHAAQLFNAVATTMDDKPEPKTRLNEHNSKQQQQQTYLKSDEQQTRADDDQRQRSGEQKPLSARSPERTGSSSDKVSHITEMSPDGRDNNKSCASNTTPVDVCSSQGGTSLEEPRSFSTFAATIGDRIIVGPTAIDGHEHSLQPLDFDQDMSRCDVGKQHQVFGNSQTTAMRLIAPPLQRRSRLRRITNRSESNTFTGDETEDTSYMPTWVRNEYKNYKYANNNQPDCVGQQSVDSESSSTSLSSSPAASEERTSQSKQTDVTLANPEDIGLSRGIESSGESSRDQSSRESFNHCEVFESDQTEYDEQEPTTTEQRTSRRRKLLSFSQPDLSDATASARFETPRVTTRRCSSVENDLEKLTATRNANLLDCSVYQKSNCSSAHRESYNEDVPRSTLSSKYSSSSPLIEPRLDSSVENDMQIPSANCTDHQLDTDRLSGVPVQDPLVHCDSFDNSVHELMLKDSPILFRSYEGPVGELNNNNDGHDYNRNQKECYRRFVDDSSLMSKSMQLDGRSSLEKSINAPAVANDELFRQQSRIKMASCSSINSLRKSISKICC